MIEMNLPDMSCGHCVSTVAQTVQEVDPKARVEVDLATKLVRIESSDGRQVFADALTEAGYPPAG
jgi:copper chaperone